jgi:hypothetical protein
LLERASDQLLLGLAIMGATTANALVYPYTLQQAGLWRVCSAAMFALGLWLSAWLAWRAIRLSGSHASASAVPVPSTTS